MIHVGQTDGDAPKPSAGDQLWPSLIKDLPQLSQAVATDCQDQVCNISKSKRSWRNSVMTTGRSTNNLIYMVTSPEVNSRSAAALQSCFLLLCVLNSKTDPPRQQSVRAGAWRKSCFWPRCRRGGARGCLLRYRFHDRRSTGYSTDTFVLRGQLRIGRPGGEQAGKGCMVKNWTNFKGTTSMKI